MDFLWALVVCSVFLIVWCRRKLYYCSWILSGPQTLPLVGNALKFLCKKEDILHTFIDLVNQYPSPVRLWMGPKLVLVVKDANQLQTILQSSKITTKAFVYRFLEPFLGKGLFTSSGSYHKNQRKLLQPLFTQKIIEGYSYIFLKHANKFVADVRKHANGPEFDILYYLHESAFECSIDLLLGDHSRDYKQVPHFIRRFYEIVFSRVHNFWLHFDFIYQKTAYYREEAMMKKMSISIIDEILSTKVPEVLEKLNNGHKYMEDCRSPSVLEMMTEMVQNDPKCFTVQECTDHLMTFMATSQDTQSSAVAFTCMMLGAYPEAQHLVFKELKEVLQNRTTIDLVDVSQMKYLEMCIKESMRLFPVAPFIFRETTEDFALGEITIPENTTVALSIYHAHRDPNFWEKPNEFYPEHFLAEAVRQRHPYAFIPFSAGPRKCIAQQYSYANMKILLSTILLNYEIVCDTKVGDIRLMTDISIRPIGGYMVRLKERL